MFRSGRVAQTEGQSYRVADRAPWSPAQLVVAAAGILFIVIGGVALARAGLHFDQSRQQGVVFHMISCLTECGRIGMTAVGDTPEDAWRLYQEAEEVLLREADLALQEEAIR